MRLPVFVARNFEWPCEMIKLFATATEATPLRSALGLRAKTTGLASSPSLGYMRLFANAVLSSPLSLDSTSLLLDVSTKGHPFKHGPNKLLIYLNFWLSLALMTPSLEILAIKLGAFGGLFARHSVPGLEA